MTRRSTSLKLIVASISVTPMVPALKLPGVFTRLRLGLCSTMLSRVLDPGVSTSATTKGNFLWQP